MNRERLDRIDRVFQSALDVAAEHRPAFLEVACGGDAELLAEVASLLSAHDKAGDFIEGSASDVAASLLETTRQRPMHVSQYKIERLLGRGGMGEVFLALDTRLNRRVALKLFPMHLAEDEERVHRFRREALAASALNHPNILTIYEIGDEGERPYIAAEFVDGVTLRTRMQDRRLSLADALDIVQQIAGALGAAHDAGIVHRDLKPENVMIRPDGLVKILDFGIAKFTEVSRLHSPEDQRMATATGIAIGTTAYMSPEQARGVSVDARTDLWSVGVMLYELAARRLPFTGTTPADRISSILQRDPVPLSKGFPPGLERIIRRALAKNRDDRYARAAELAKDLRALRASLGDEHHRTLSLPGLIQGIPRLSKLQAAVATALFATVVALGFIGFLQRGAAIESLAVLPLSNVEGSADTEHLSDGISESLINSLSQLPNLKVMSRHSVFRYKGKDVDANAVANALDVQAVLMGRLVIRGDDLLVSVELVDTRDNTQVWGDQYARKMADLVALPGEIAHDVSRKLRAKLSRADEQRLAKNYTENAPAYELYLRGRYHLAKLTPAEVQASVSYFQQAIAVDPSYALAYVGLADAYSALALSVDMPAAEFYPKARAAAETALGIDSSLADAHTSIGFAIQFYDWDWNAAENQYKRALQLNPNSADTHLYYASLSAIRGRHAEAVAEAKRARELDPLNLRIGALEGRFLALAGRTDDGLARLQKTVELEPNYFLAHLFAAGVHMEKGRYADGIIEATKAKNLSGGNAEAMAWIGYGLMKAGKRDEARAVLDQLKQRATERYVPPYDLALLQNALGQTGEALASLERGVEQRDPKVLFLKSGRTWDNLRNDLRFQALLRRVGLAQ